MKITRVVNNETMEFKLTNDELIACYPETRILTIAYDIGSCLWSRNDLDLDELLRMAKEVSCDYEANADREEIYWSIINDCVRKYKKEN